MGVFWAKSCCDAHVCFRVMDLGYAIEIEAYSAEIVLIFSGVIFGP